MEHFPRPKRTIVERGKEVSAHVHLPALVHSLRTLLAVSAVGADRLSLRLAAPAPVPHRRGRRSRRSGDHFSGHHIALSPAGRTLSDLTNQKNLEDAPRLARFPVR